MQQEPFNPKASGFAMSSRHVFASGSIQASCLLSVSWSCLFSEHPVSDLHGIYNNLLTILAVCSLSIFAFWNGGSIVTGSVLLPSESLNSRTTAHGSPTEMAVLGWCSSLLSVATIRHSGPKQRRGGKDTFQLTGYSPSLRGVRERARLETWSRNHGETLLADCLFQVHA